MRHFDCGCGEGGEAGWKEHTGDLKCFSAFSSTCHRNITKPALSASLALLTHLENFSAAESRDLSRWFFVGSCEYVGGVVGHEF